MTYAYWYHENILHTRESHSELRCQPNCDYFKSMATDRPVDVQSTFYALLTAEMSRNGLAVFSLLSSSASATKSLHIGLEHIFPTWTKIRPMFLCLPAAWRTFTIRYTKYRELVLNMGWRNAVVLKPHECWNNKHVTKSSTVVKSTSSDYPVKLMLCRYSLLHLAGVLFNNTESSSFLRVPDYSIPHLWSPQ